MIGEHLDWKWNWHGPRLGQKWNRASVEIASRDFLGGVGAEDADFGGAHAQFFEGGDRVGIMKSGLEVEVKAVLPRSAGNGAALDF